MVVIRPISYILLYSYKLTGSARCRLGTDYSYNMDPGQIIAILMLSGSSCRRGARLKVKMDPP